MNIKKTIISTIILWIVGVVFTFLTCGWLFSWVYRIPPNIWKSQAEMMSLNNMIFSNFAGIFKALVFILVFGVLYRGIPGQGVKRGLRYGFLVWMVGTLFGMITMPLYMTISETVVIYWMLQALVINLINGAIVGAIYK